MPRAVPIAMGVEATLMTYTTFRPSRMLLLNAHGMQDQAFLEPIAGNAVPIPPRSYALTVPWDRALYNPFFKQTEANIYRYATNFSRNAGQFDSRVPRLAIYPFYDDVTWCPAFEAFILRDICDVAHFVDLSNGTDFIMLEDLLRAPHWGGVGTIADRYDSFLLLTCRSSLARGIGLGGAQPAHPNGLFRGDDQHNPTIAL